MARRRLVLLVTLAALVAPWVAPCLAAAPANHAAMACCHPGAPSAPVAGPCCAPADGQPAVPTSDAVRLSQMAAPVVLAWTTAPVALVSPVHSPSKPLLSIQPRLLFRVLLI